MKHFLIYVYGSCQAGDRNGGVEEYDSYEAAESGIHNLMADHPDAVWKLIEGIEVSRS